MWNWKQIAALVPHERRAQVDWQGCLDAFAPLQLARTTPQDPVYHAEGDVWTHTQMVIEQLLADDEYLQLQARERETVFLAALLHDVAKCRTTQIDAQGRISVRP